MKANMYLVKFSFGVIRYNLIPELKPLTAILQTSSSCPRHASCTTHLRLQHFKRNITEQHFSTSQMCSGCP